MRIRIKDEIKPREIRCGNYIRRVRPGMELSIKQEFWGVFKDIAIKIIKEKENANGE